MLSIQEMASSAYLSFTVESEREREEWIEAVQESIVETLCNYEVLEKVWFNMSNRKCADCQAPEPEWASINLSTAASSIWTNELIELFLDVGNKNSNSFWEANLPPEEELCMQPSLEQRASFIRRKYKKRKYKKVLEGLNTQEELNKVSLCATVVLPDILQTMALVFSGADVMCATGDPQYSTPYLLAQKGQRLQMEFLYHHKLSDLVRPLVYIWKVDSLYYENEKNATAIGRVDVSDVLYQSTHMEGDEKIQVLLMVETPRGRTVYIHGITKQDFALWHSSIQFGSWDGTVWLSANQQLNKNGCSIIVDSCIAFVTQYVCVMRGIYQKNGDPGRVAQYLHDFTKNARVVKLWAQEHRLEDVTDTLKSFLSHREDALLAKELYPFWISALDEQDEKVRVQKYSTYIQSLPKVNRFNTFIPIFMHIYLHRIQRCSHINQMNTQNLACVFSSCLFQTEGHTAQESRVVEDLINNYTQLFSVSEEQVRQMEKENSFITRWKDTTFSPAGDLIFEVYLEKKEPEKCCLIKVSPSMRSDELAISTLEMKGMEVKAQDLWTTFEVIENGEMERPLHYKEKILEQVLEWSSLEDPSSAFLLIKKYSGSKMTDSNSDKLKDFIKGEQLKFKDGSSKLLLGNKFQDRYLVLQDKKLLLYKDIKSTKPEREAPLKSVKCYLGLRRKLKPTSSWGFTVYTKKQQWYFCCKGNESQQDWVTSIIRVKHASDLWPKDLRQSASLPYNLSRGRTSTYSTAKTSTARHQREAKGKSVLTTSIEGSNTQNQMTSDVSNQPDLTHKLASCEGTPSVSGLEMVIDDTLQSLRRPSLQQDPSALTQLSHKKAVLPSRGAQLPQNLINELSTVLNKTGRFPKEDN
ncbi:LOW QUALITY PROTEIN: arf-GAP with Rho-GAP domain, ANK repeat and PH domain-containing protein 2 [Cyprinus carpio]|uniref:LOW QUALITY PROTEIN: arf-GAP with Rho-GAP domain, ANK repeat and PH domain-containing protein 2 n=1 Tax=Cyprinus carpio TaxID=7962 RepID=A0A9R0A2M6_CYPCA|nr:LOW QUALITY PROTEIN: arf-GAP with Rho-GAP domain, ANK repeat and PH domain-containing protein 2 [Cyprinus carpio]